MPENLVKGVIEAMSEMVKGELPEPTHEFSHYEDILVEMRDGVKLMTRVLFPEGSGPWPVILVRNPYTPVNSDLHMLQPIFVLLKYGYVVVYQQVRGAFESEGEWLPFEHERMDGLDTLQWLIQQVWMDGNIALFGGSYLGHVQWCLADQLPPEVKTMYFSIYGGDSYESFYKNGMFRFGGWAFWAMEMIEPHRNLDVDPLQVRNLSIERFRKILMTRPHISADEQIFGKTCTWYRNWVTNQHPDSDYWTQGYWGKYQQIAEQLSIPVTIQTGWFDFFFDSIVKTYPRIPETTRNESRFIIAPWHHGNMVGGDLSYPNDNILGTALVRDALEWFDHHLKGRPYAHPKGVVEAYVIGEGKWETTPDWIEPAGVRTYYLHQPKDATGELLLHKVNQASSATYVYDPDDPVITQGGNLLISYPNLEQNPETSIAQEPSGARKDILAFVSEILTADLRISGAIKACLYVKSDVEDTCFTVKVMEVFENGVANNIRDGICTLVMRNGIQPQSYFPGSVVQVTLELAPILWAVRKGSRIRCDISSSNFPAYHNHPNVAGNWASQEKVVTANQKIYFGGYFSSYLEIPIRS